MDTGLLLPFTTGLRGGKAGSVLGGGGVITFTTGLCGGKADSVLEGG